jgi:hypothetical protein
LNLPDEKINKVFPGRLNGISLKKFLNQIHLLDLISASSYLEKQELELIGENLIGFKKNIFLIAGSWRKNRNYRLGNAKKAALRIDTLALKMLKQGEITLLQNTIFPAQDSLVPEINAKRPNPLDKNKFNAMTQPTKKITRDPQYHYNPDNPNSMEKFLGHLRKIPPFHFDPEHLAKILLGITQSLEMHGAGHLKTIARECPNGFLADALEKIARGVSGRAFEEMLANSKKRLLFEFETLLDLTSEGLLAMQKGEKSESLVDKFNSFY